MKKYVLSLLSFFLFSLLFTGTSYAASSQLDLTQLASNGNGKVTFKILNPPAGFDFSSLTVGASWDNSNWAYAISYEGGCPDACVVEWQGTGIPFYMRLMDQNSTITFNEPINGGAFNTPYIPLNLQQLASDGNGKVTFKILNPPSGFDFSSLYSAGASWDNSNWVYAISYEGGCPDACVVEWQGQTTTPFSVKLANQTQSIIFNQSVSPIPITLNGTNVSVTEGVAFSGVVATGTYSGSGTLSASINWGDGTSASVGTASLNGSTLSVTGSHTYAEEGSYALTVTVTDGTLMAKTSNFSATVSDAALTLEQFAARRVSHLTAGVAAQFIDADPAGTVSDYTATVTWGDGTTSTLTVFKNSLGAGFVLAGSHTYATKGTYSVTLTISDQGGSQLTKSANVTVK